MLTGLTEINLMEVSSTPLHLSSSTTGNNDDRIQTPELSLAEEEEVLRLDPEEEDKKF